MKTNEQGPTKPLRSRRRFMKSMLAMTAGAGAASYWASTSRRRSARWLRQIVADARRPVIAASVKPDPRRWPENAITICWLGHATTLINFYGVHILTDPAFFDRIGLSFGLGTLGLGVVCFFLWSRQTRQWPFASGEGLSDAI